MSEYRINGFEQIKAFYSWVFNNAKERVTPQHISLYLFLINQNNRSNWIEWFKVPFDLGMAGACIGNKKTYYSCLNDLVSWNLIEYEKGTNEYKAPLIKIAVLKSTSHDTAAVPLPEPLLQPLPTTLPIPLPTHIYKLITDNIKLITDNEVKFEKFIESLKENKSKENNKEDEIPIDEKPFNYLEYHTYYDLVEHAKKEESWFNSLLRLLKLEKETILSELENFPIVQEAKGNKITNLKEFKNHFFNYMNLRKDDLRKVERKKSEISIVDRLEIERQKYFEILKK